MLQSSAHALLYSTENNCLILKPYISIFEAPVVQYCCMKTHDRDVLPCTIMYTNCRKCCVARLFMKP